MKRIKNVLYSSLFFVLIVTIACKMNSIKNIKNDGIKVRREMVFIPEGEVILGTDKEILYEDNGYSIIPYVIPPLPRKKVYLDAFYIDKLETTNAEYQRFIEDGGYQRREFWSEDGWKYIKKTNTISEPLFWSGGEEHHSGPEFPDYPVVGVSWYEAAAYARWMGKGLPKEEEWEKAARGADGRMWPWGDDFSERRLNSLETGIYNLVPAGMFPSGASPYHVMDMAGNVLEWTATRYRGDLPPAAGEDYLYPYNKEFVLRGGAFRYTQQIAATFTRIRHWVGERRPDCSYATGFRLARGKG